MTHIPKYSTVSLAFPWQPMLAILIILLFGCDQSPPPEQLLPTTIVLVRHAEKEMGGVDPVLTEDGELRALELAFVLENTDLDAIYSTSYKRTLQTAEPVAEEKELDISIYQENDPETFLSDLLDAHSGGTVLIVGHSTNIPGLANLLTGTSDIPASATYDRLLVATVFKLGTASMTSLQYRQ